MPLLPSTVGLAGLLFWAVQTVNALKMPYASLTLTRPENTVGRPLRGLGVPRYHQKRHISARDMSALLDHHNHVRASMYPPATNLEYMVRDEQLARSAKAWPTQCTWAHGPSQLMRYVGQNPSIHSGWYHSLVDLVRSWSGKQHDLIITRKDCNLHCPWCNSGSVHSHYTQVLKLSPWIECCGITAHSS
ncbi:peptidase inhibitor R3HDML [Otolemur garnettii]|uniref:peptidase inhibitor R3HDML n=1 Tax=Otolemur garnettii TaxID=30611 RepID=UPI000C7EF32C|nr:peptidase inhibitor R3HDML [Otolemur garnettii]